MRVQENYKWQAELFDGSIVDEKEPDINKRGDMTNCAKFSLIPQSGVLLPQFDIVGVKMIRRFCRGFAGVNFAGKKELKGLFFWVKDSRTIKTSVSQVREVLPFDMIGKGIDGDEWYYVEKVEPDKITLFAPYKGATRPKGWRAIKLIQQSVKADSYLHCIVCDTFRIYFNYANGATLVTPKDYELYL
jgi:hypothetical protein